MSKLIDLYLIIVATIPIVVAAVVVFVKAVAFGLFVYVVLRYLTALPKAFKDQYNKQEDLILNENNEIISGTVMPHPEVKQPRPQPTWMN